MILAILAAAAVAASPACPKPPRGQPKAVSTNPDWLIKPSPDDIWWAYPPKAREEVLPGYVVISCEVSVEGKLEACTIPYEDPKGYGFGEAALSLTAKMLMKPGTQCGKVVRSKVGVPLNFVFAQERPSPEGPPPTARALELATRLSAALGSPKTIMEQWVIYHLDEEDNRRSTSADERRAFHEAATETLAAAETKITAAIARAYARYLTEEELARAVEFYESSVAGKLKGIDLNVDTQLMKDLYALNPELEDDLRTRYCGRVQAACTPDDAI